MIRNFYETNQASLKDILLYDERKGYFSIAKLLRRFVVILRTYVFLISYLKDMFGRNDWITRRTAVEIITISKVVVLCLVYFVIELCKPEHINAFGYLLLYMILDTVTYLLALIFLSDIQKTSANAIRSMIMLAINYIEISLNMSMLCYIFYYGKVTLQQVIFFGLMGIEPEMPDFCINGCFLYFNGLLKFFL